MTSISITLSSEADLRDSFRAILSLRESFPGKEKPWERVYLVSMALSGEMFKGSSFGISSSSILKDGSSRYPEEAAAASFALTLILPAFRRGLFSSASRTAVERVRGGSSEGKAEKAG